MEERLFGPVRFIPGKNQGRYPFCHSIYIEGAGVLIDPASDRKRLIEVKKELGIREVWLSHWHEDHIMDLDLFDDIPLCISKYDAPPLSDLDLFLDAYGDIHEEARDYFTDMLTKQFHFRPRKPDRFLENGEIFHFDKVTVEVISAPGHTPGHLAFFFREPGVLFMADYDLTKFGPWYGDIESSIEDTIKSVNHLRNIPATVWITCHGTGVFERDPGRLWNQYLDVISAREEKILKLLEKPQTLTDIVGAWIIMGKQGEPKALSEWAERIHIKKHLQKLIEEQVVTKEGEKYLKL